MKPALQVDMSSQINTLCADRSVLFPCISFSGAHGAAVTEPKSRPVPTATGLIDCKQQFRLTFLQCPSPMEALQHAYIVP